MYEYYGQHFVFSASGANSTLQPPPAVNVVFEEKTEDPKIIGLFTVNISWTHPIGMYVCLCIPIFCDKSLY